MFLAYLSSETNGQFIIQEKPREMSHSELSAVALLRAPRVRLSWALQTSWLFNPLMS